MIYYDYYYAGRPWPGKRTAYAVDGCERYYRARDRRAGVVGEKYRSGNRPKKSPAGAPGVSARANFGTTNFFAPSDMSPDFRPSVQRDNVHIDRHELTTWSSPSDARVGNGRGSCRVHNAFFFLHFFPPFDVISSVATSLSNDGEKYGETELIPRDLENSVRNIYDVQFARRNTEWYPTGAWLEQVPVVAMDAKLLTRFRLPVRTFLLWTKTVVVIPTFRHILLT